MKRLLTTTAFALLIATPAFAEAPAKTQMEEPGRAMTDTDRKQQTADAKSDKMTTANATYYTNSEKKDFYASKLIGARIYASELDVNSENVDKNATKEWDDIGEINNLVIGRNGEVKAVVLGVGGFLGIGEKDVAIQMSSLNFVKEKGAENSDYFIVVKSSKAELEKAPTYKMASN